MPWYRWASGCVLVRAQRNLIKSSRHTPYGVCSYGKWQRTDDSNKQSRSTSQAGRCMVSGKSGKKRNNEARLRQWDTKVRTHCVQFNRSLCRYCSSAKMPRKYSHVVHRMRVVFACVHRAAQACSRFHLHRSDQYKGHRFDYLFIYLFESEPPHMIPWKPYASISAIETFPLCWATQRSESKTTSVFSADDFSLHISIVGPFIFVIPLFRCLRWQHTWALYMGLSDIASRLTDQFLSVEQK